MTVTTYAVYQQRPSSVMKQAVINDSSGSAVTIQAAVAGSVIRVWRAFLYVAGGADITFNSYNSVGPVTTPLAGPMGPQSGAFNISLEINSLGIPWYSTLTGESLQIIASSAQRITGIILYTIEIPSP